MLVGRRIGQRICLHRLLVEFGTGRLDDEGDGLVALEFVGHGNHGRLVDAGMAVPSIFSLRRVDVLAPPHTNMSSTRPTK